MIAPTPLATGGAAERERVQNRDGVDSSLEPHIRGFFAAAPGPLAWALQVQDGSSATPPQSASTKGVAAAHPTRSQTKRQEHVETGTASNPFVISDSEEQAWRL